MGTSKKLLFVLFSITIIFSISLVSSLNEAKGFLGTFEQSKDIELLQVCSGGTSLCGFCNISSVKYPNSSIALSNVMMTQRSGDFNYTLIANKTQTLGTYGVNGYCVSGTTKQVWVYDFEVTVNGKDKPDGIVIVLFTLLFLVIVAGLLSLLMYNIFHMAQWDFDAKDLIYNFSAYFLLLAVYILGKDYLGNSFVNNFLEFVIWTTALTNILIPVIAFIMSYIKGNLRTEEQKQYD